MNRLYWLTLCLILLVLVSCQDSLETGPTEVGRGDYTVTIPDLSITDGPPEPAAVQTVAVGDRATSPSQKPNSDGKNTFFAYTHQRSDGNRLVNGKGKLPEMPFVDIQLDGVPQWVVAAPAGTGGEDSDGSI